MKSLTAEDIKAIHLELERRFPSMERGMIQGRESLLESLAEKPDRQVFGQPSPYTDVFSKAAVLMEGLARWHIFVDGNKRTGLVAAFFYLHANKRRMAIPIDSARFTIRVADYRGDSEEETNELIGIIAQWLRRHAGRDGKGFAIKCVRNVLLPVIKVRLLYLLGFKKRAEGNIAGWFALDTHGDYLNEAISTTRLVSDLTAAAVKEIRQAGKIKRA